MLTGGLANEEASELSEIRPQGMGGHFSNLPTIDLPVPDAAPRKRWTRGLAESLCLRIGVVFNEDGTLDVAVPDPSHRLKAAFAHNTVYSSASSLPAHSFVDLGVGVAIACPELIFAEMAETMDTPQLALLGYELCGSFARDSRDPRNGDVAVKVSPVTSVGKIRRFIEEAKWLRASERALYALEYVADNAWSPTESVLAVIASLPIGEFGYEMGRCLLNVRVEASETLSSVNDKVSRVPDILFEGANVGFNYDGAIHLDLGSVVAAAVDAERHPDEAYAQMALADVIRGVRAKAVDDIRRNRELAAAGYVVFPVTKEDLYEEGGLDRVMAQAIEALEAFAGRDMSLQRRLMRSEFIRKRRQELVWSLLPGCREKILMARADRARQSLQPPIVFKMMIGF